MSANLISLGDLKSGELPSLINLCKDDPRFTMKVNRALEFLLNCGSFWGTTRLAHFCVQDGCIVLPACLATIEAVRNCDRAVTIQSNWYRMLWGHGGHGCCGDGMYDFEYIDQVPSFNQLCAARVLRSFVADSTDYGKKIKFLGYDKNKRWVRTRQNGLMKDGEVVTFASPFVDTQTEWTSVTNAIKDETDDTVTVFSKALNEDVLHAFATYEYWETKPSYQRFRLHERIWNNANNGCCLNGTVEAEVKLAYIPVKYDDDLLPITNRIGMEMAVTGVKALDDGDLGRSDLLLFGDQRNKRLGAIAMLNQEIRTNTADRTATAVRVGGPCGFRTQMRGFI